MGKFDTTKLTVLTIGVLAVLAALMGAIIGLEPIGYGFGLYIGITLIGSVVLHKENEHKTNRS